MHVDTEAIHREERPGVGKVVELNCELKHGVRLIVRNNSGKVKLSDVVDFLAGAVNYFKHQCETVGDAAYGEMSYSAPVRSGRGREIGTVELAIESNESLPAALWCDATIAAYVIVDTVEQMLESVDDWRERAVGHLHLAEMLNMHKRPNGDLLAMAIMLRHDLHRQ